MKKFLVLLLVPLLISAAFAGNITLSQTAKLELQTKVLYAMNYLKFTSTQASAIAQNMKKFKVAVNSLENDRIKELTMLRDALIKNDETQISMAKKMIAETDKKYEKTTLDFVNSIKSIITLEQAERAKAIFEKEKLLFSRKQMPFMNKIRNPKNQNQQPMNQLRNPENQPKQQLPHPYATKQNQRTMKARSATGIEEFGLMMRKTEFIHSLVNSDIYNVLLKTIELKAK